MHDLAQEYGIRSPGAHPGVQSQQWCDRVLNVHAQAQRTGKIDPDLVRDASAYAGRRERAACWKGYRKVGMKTKNGRKVPNCVPIKNGKPEKEQAMRREMLVEMARLEERAGKAFDDMSPQEKTAYLRAHPGSKFKPNMGQRRTDLHNALQTGTKTPVGRELLNRAAKGRPIPGPNRAEHEKWPHHPILQKAGLDHVGTQNGAQVYEHEGTAEEVHVHPNGSWKHVGGSPRHGGVQTYGSGADAKSLHHHISGWYDEDD